MMPYPVRRKDRQLSVEQSQAILEQGEYLVLAMTDTRGFPYALPLSYVVKDGKIYFHGAVEGKKVDALQNGTRVWVVVVGATERIYDRGFSTCYESVMVDGCVHTVTDEKEKYGALFALAQRYLPEYMDKADHDIRVSLGRTAVYAITPLSMTGKAERKITG